MKKFTRKIAKGIVKFLYNFDKILDIEGSTEGMTMWVDGVLYNPEVRKCLIRDKIFSKKEFAKLDKISNIMIKSFGKTTPKTDDLIPEIKKKLDSAIHEFLSLLSVQDELKEIKKGKNEYPDLF